MAYRVANAASVTFATNTNQWYNVSMTPTMGAGNTSLGAGTLTSTAWTSPGATNNFYGCLVFMNVVNTSGNIDFGLYDGVTLLGTQTVNFSSAFSNAFYFVQFATPIVMSDLTASAYTVKIVRHAGSAASTAFAQDGSANIWCFPCDDRYLAFNATDDYFIVGGNSFNPTATVSGLSNVCGDNVAAKGGINTSLRQLGLAVTIAQGGTLTYDTTQSDTLTVKGMVGNCNGGTFSIGTPSVPFPAAFTATFTVDSSSGTNNGSTSYGYYSGNTGGTNGGKTSFYGAIKTYQASTLASGTGTTGSPLVMADPVDWSVGDYIIVASTDINSHSEYKYIRVKNSSTSYTLADTSGGVEAGLVNTHLAGACIANLTSNINVLGFSTTANIQFFAASLNTFDYNAFSGVTFNNFTGVIGRSGGSVIDFILNNCVGLASSGNTAGFNLQSGSANSQCNNTITAGNNLVNSSMMTTSTNSMTYNHYYGLWTGRTQMVLTGNGNTFNNATFADVNSQKSIGNAITINGSSNTFNTCTFNASQGITIAPSGAFNNVFNSCTFGAVGVTGQNSGADVAPSAATLSTTYFNTCTFNETLASGYTSALIGTLIAFQKTNSTNNYNKWYSYTGSAQATGAGLADTNTRTAGELSLRLSPESLTGQSWSFNILATPSQFVAVQGFIQLNSTFTGDAAASCRVDLYLPGSTTPDQTVTIPKTTNNFQVFSLAVNYPGTIYNLATVVVTACSTTAGAYAYVADLYNGTNAFINLSVWNNGQPSPVMFQQVGDPLAVWSVLTSAVGISGTTGKKLIDGLTTSKFIGLK